MLSPTLSLEFSFCFVSSPFLGLGIFLLFVFSSEGKDYGELGFWLKACRTAVHDIFQERINKKEEKEKEKKKKKKKS